MPRLLDDRFKDQGNAPLVASDAVLAEGQRIRDALAAGTYGNQPVAAAAAERGTDSGTFGIPQGDAEHERQFGNSFFNQPTMWEQNQNPAQLRQTLRLDELKTRAAAGKLALERAQNEGPTKDAYAKAQLEHELAATEAIGGTTRFKHLQDAATMKHVTGFADYMTSAPPVNSPDYRNYVLAGVHAFPRVAGTAWGKTTLGQIGQEHDTIAALKAQLPEGFDISSVGMGRRGATVRLKPTGGDVALEKDAKGLGLTLGRIRNPVNAQVGRRDDKGKWVGDEKGNLVRVEGPKGAMITMPATEYERLGGKYSGATESARKGGTTQGATKHLGTYNPATGTFE